MGSDSSSPDAGPILFDVQNERRRLLEDQPWIAARAREYLVSRRGAGCTVDQLVSDACWTILAGPYSRAKFKPPPGRDPAAAFRAHATRSLRNWWASRSMFGEIDMKVREAPLNERTATAPDTDRPNLDRCLEILNHDGDPKAAVLRSVLQAVRQGSSIRSAARVAGTRRRLDVLIKWARARYEGSDG